MGLNPEVRQSLTFSPNLLRSDQKPKSKLEELETEIHNLRIRDKLALLDIIFGELSASQRVFFITSVLNELNDTEAAHILQILQDTFAHDIGTTMTQSPQESSHYKIPIRHFTCALNNEYYFYESGIHFHQHIRKLFVVVDGIQHEVQLSKRESSLLHLLLSECGTVVSRNRIFKQFGKAKDYTDNDDSCVETTVSRLRKKLDDFIREHCKDVIAPKPRIKAFPKIENAPSDSLDIDKYGGYSLSFE